MKLLIVRACVLGSLFASAMFQGSTSWAADWPPVASDAASEKIREALANQTTLEFIETPMQDVVDYLKDLHDVEIQLDSKALGEQGIGSDSPITRNLKGITLGSALRLMLGEMELTYTVRDEVLLITTPEEVEGYVYSNAYDVGPLLEEGGTADTVADALRSTIRDGDDLRLSITSFRNLLIVRHHEYGHAEVQRLLGLMGMGLGVAPPARKIGDLALPAVLPRRNLAHRETPSTEPQMPPLPGAEDMPEEPAVTVAEPAQPPDSSGFDPFGTDAIGGETVEDPGIPGIDDPFAEPPPVIEKPAAPKPPPEPEVDDRDPFEP